MKAFFQCLILTVLQFVSLNDGGRIDYGIQGFKVEILHKPDDCSKKSERGDQMFVNFVGRKIDGGEEFDKR